MKLSLTFAIIAVFATTVLASPAKLFCDGDKGAVKICSATSGAPDWLKNVTQCEQYVDWSGWGKTLRNCFHNTLSATSPACADILPTGKCHGETGYCDRYENACGFNLTNRFTSKDKCKEEVKKLNGVAKACIDSHLQFAADDAAKNASMHCEHASFISLCKPEGQRAFGVALRRSTNTGTWPTPAQVRQKLADQLKWAIGATELGTDSLQNELSLDDAFNYKSNETDANITQVLRFTVTATQQSFEEYFNTKALMNLTEFIIDGVTYKVSVFRQCPRDKIVSETTGVCGGLQCGCPVKYPDTTACVKQSTELLEGLDRKKCMNDKLNRGLYLMGFQNNLTKQDTICAEIDKVHSTCTEEYLIAEVYEKKSCGFGSNLSYPTAAKFREDLAVAGKNVKKCLLNVLNNDKLPNGMPLPNGTKCMEGAGKGNCNQQTSFTFTAKCGNATCTLEEMKKKITEILGKTNDLTKNFDLNDFGPGLLTQEGNNFKITLKGPVLNGTNLGSLLTAQLPSDVKVEGFASAPVTPIPNAPVKSAAALVATLSALLCALATVLLL